MHLDPRGRPFQRAVRRRDRARSRAELRVQAEEQVLVEGRRHAERIVVGEQQIGIRLDEIGAEQEAVAGPERRADRGEAQPRRGSKLPMFEPRKSTSAVPDPRQAAPAVRPRKSRGARSRRTCGSSSVRAPAPSEIERGVREVDEVSVTRRGRRLEQQREASLSPLPEPSSSSWPNRAPRLHLDAACCRQQAEVGPRDAIPGQPTDGVEERRAERIVEEARGSCLGVCWR